MKINQRPLVYFPSIRNIFFFRLILVLILSTTSVYADEFQKGQDAFENNDYKTAFKIFKPLAEQGSAKAQLILSFFYQGGLGTMRDQIQSITWLRKSADQGFAPAQFNLGASYNNGQGVTKDYNKALRWYKLSAQQGHTASLYNIGAMYAKGQGVPKNYRETIKWYKLSAMLGNLVAQYDLGAMHIKGQGTPKNYKKACDWYKLAANYGDASAQFQLALCYGGGRGAEKDLSKAYMWSTLAGKNGAWLRKELDKELTPNQIAEARKLAEQWKETPFVALTGKTTTRNYEIPDHGVLQLPVPKLWLEEVRYPPDSLPPTITFTPISGKTFEVLITALYPFRKGSSLPTGPELRIQVKQVSEKYKGKVKEKKIPLTEMKTEDSTGYCFSITEKLDKPDEYKYMTHCQVVFKKIMLTFSTFTNPGSYEAVDEAITMLKKAAHIPEN
ncbi:MAG: tetratricopeptide repeat protein [Nitrospinales bacterium]